MVWGLCLSLGWGPLEEGGVLCPGSLEMLHLEGKCLGVFTKWDGGYGTHGTVFGIEEGVGPQKPLLCG